MTRRAAFLNFCAVPIAAAQIIITPGSTTFGPPKDPVRYAYVAEWAGEKMESEHYDFVLGWVEPKIRHLLIAWGWDLDTAVYHSRNIASGFVRRITL